MASRLRFRFADGQELTAAGELRFRSFDALRRSLDDAGFVVREAYGDWDRRPFGARSREIIVVAERT